MNVMSRIDSEKLESICNEVFRDRSSVVEGRGFLSVEAALARAVYWRLCKSTVFRSSSSEKYGAQTFSTYRLAVNCLIELNGRPSFDCGPFLEELIQRCDRQAQHDHERTLD